MRPKDTEENLKKCICAGCPVYDECTRGKNELLFCAKKVSECDLDKTKMCTCPACPVFKESELKGGYYCIYDLPESGDNSEAMMKGQAKVKK